MSKKQKTLTIKNPVLLSYLRRLNRTGIYGGRETEAAWKLINDQLAHLIDSGELEKLESHAKQTIEMDRFVTKDTDNKTGTN